MTARRAPKRYARTGISAITSLLVSVTLLAVCAGTAAAATRPGVDAGVTPKEIKVGIALVDFDCIKDFTDSIRTGQEKTYQAFIDDINAKGGINGRTIDPVYDSYCPIGSAGPLSVCTKLTEDDKVFAVIGTFIDFSGDAQTCVAKQHDTVLMTYNLTKQIIDKAPGLIVYPGATNERTAAVLLQLLKKQKTLKGKKVAVLGGANEANVVKKTIVPGLKKMGVSLGSTAVLSSGGASTDTSSAQAQLESFIERWKSEHVDDIFLSGNIVSAKEFVTKIKQEMPDVQLLVDNTDVRSQGRDLVSAGVKPNPYEGIIAAGGPTPAEYQKSANWKYCKGIYEKQTGTKAQTPTQVVKDKAGKILDNYGTLNDACQVLTMFDDIATKAGKDLTTATWVKAVNAYGPITNRGSGPYSSIHAGKYDAEDSFRLEEFSTKVKGGDWKGIGQVQDITGS